MGRIQKYSVVNINKQPNTPPIGADYFDFASLLIFHSYELVNLMKDMKIPQGGILYIDFRCAEIGNEVNLEIEKFVKDPNVYFVNIKKWKGEAFYLSPNHVGDIKKLSDEFLIELTSQFLLQLNLPEFETLFMQRCQNLDPNRIQYIYKSKRSIRRGLFSYLGVRTQLGKEEYFVQIITSRGEIVKTQFLIAAQRMLQDYLCYMDKPIPFIDCDLLFQTGWEGFVYKYSIGNEKFEVDFTDVITGFLSANGRNKSTDSADI